MIDSPFSKKDLLLAIFFSLIVIGLIVIGSFFDTRTKIVFCDVGQGDGAYIRIKNRVDLVIDAGPDNKILNCLGKHMPFYDRKIELAILSHPQKDHYYGFIEISKRYKIDRFVLSKADSTKQSFIKLKDIIKNKKIKVVYVMADNTINIINDRIYILWPNHILNTADDNINSLVFLFQEDNFKALFTGDANAYILDILSEESKTIISPVNILKIPHHGSKNSLSEKLFRSANPRLAVISVGKNNSYGHPTKEVLNSLKALNIKIMRTDEKGDIVYKLRK